ncbi:MAG: hypothetical protein DRO23_11895 [Thermoprotei archaeon]|nr:MAG: hypothetical protein DRO23_11895 [Thermoprotei archaeon]
MNYSITVIMPVYNGEKFIVESVKNVYDFMRKNRYRFNIVVVDDGSHDGTLNALFKLCNGSKYSNIKVISYRPNMGKGSAFLVGFRKYSNSDITVLFDADLDIPFEQIKALIETLKEKNADIVITNKWHKLSRTEASFLRKFLSIGFNCLARILTGIKFKDTQTGAKAFKTSVLKKIIRHVHTRRFTLDLELLLVAQKLGFKIIEIPSVKPIKLQTNFKLSNIIQMFVDLLFLTYKHRLNPLNRSLANI